MYINEHLYIKIFEKSFCLFNEENYTHRYTFYT